MSPPRPPLTDMAVDECFPPPIQTHVLTLPRWQSRAALALLSLIAALVGWCAVELRANRAADTRHADRLTAILQETRR